MRTPCYKKREVELGRCCRCGAAVQTAEKGYVLTRRNVPQPSHTYTAAGGRTYQIQPPPKKIQSASYGVCKSCLLEAEELLRGFMEVKNSE